MTDAEIDEMCSMVLEQSKRALREAVALLEKAWTRCAAKAPREELARLRSNLGQSINLSQALQAARGAEFPQRRSLELALRWERCRVRALITLAVQIADPVSLEAALKLAAPIGLAIDLERELCDELTERADPGTAPSLLASKAGGGPRVPKLALDSGGETEEDEESPFGDLLARTAAVLAEGRPRWWHRFWRPRPKPWEGEAELLRVVREHVQRGNEPLPKELAADLGLGSAAPILPESPLAKLSKRL